MLANAINISDFAPVKAGLVGKIIRRHEPKVRRAEKPTNPAAPKILTTYPLRPSLGELI